MESPFRRPVPRDLKVIETFGFQPDAGFVRLDRHLRRLSKTCGKLDVPVDLDACRQRLDTLPMDKSLRVRLTVDTSGVVEVTFAELAPNSEFWRIAIAAERVDAANPWLQVKTTERQLYDTERANIPDGIDELIFLNGNGEVCEGTITNIFADFGDGLVTPPLSCGLLPGILREELLESGVTEAIISAEKLTEAKQIFVGNSLRGLIPARLL